MRISSLGIFGAYREPAQVAEWARRDTARRACSERAGEENRGRFINRVSSP